MPCIRVAGLRESVAHGLEREARRIDVAHLVPAQRRRDARLRGRPDRVGGGNRPVARVLAEVDEHPFAIGHPPGRCCDPLVADPALDLLGERLGEAAHLRKRELGPDRRQDVEPGRARGLRVGAQPELAHELADCERDPPHMRPLALGARVEVDQKVVGAL